WNPFKARLQATFEALFGCLLPLYGRQYDFFYHLESILEMAARSWLSRPPELKALDAGREADPHWYQSEQMMGGVCYVDLFAGNLEGIRARTPYFKELGLTYLHLMPLFLSPEGNNDGGYAVSSYREVDPHLGTMEQLAELSTELRHNGISLVLDFVFNHTSDEHAWARRALEGDPDYQDYYLMFPDRQMPDAYERNLREIFPTVRPGSFTYRPEIERWVWTTFNSFQWDLNYANPVVFQRMAEEMLFLANQGVEVLRLDAVVFIWKRLGTSCENLPEAHLIIRAFNALARLAAPALLFKSEAIVHPDDVAEFIREDECQVSYNPLLMALLWNSLATRKVRLLRDSIRERFHIDPRCAWVNYVRSHDDIGWTFDDGDAARLGINAFDHRQFLNAFYIGRFEGSFARGLPFQENPRTGDARVSGTAASLAGLEKALHDEAEAEVELAIRRILLLYSVVLTIGGIPLLYFGDETGTLNDYGYRNDPAKAGDSRWIHRPFTDWARVARRSDPTTVEGRIYGELCRLIEVRKRHAVFAGVETDVIDTGNDHVFGYVRRHEGGRVLVLANFTEREQRFAANQARLYGLGYAFTDLVAGQAITLDGDVLLEPYRFVWMVPA
ncbi:MAG: alpha-amylase family glycosyl hydrolase, partial [Chloroflexota bacterium]|nr:alpha-amylase family glycosyl hydrolase [Chloroflexota bacterium]